MLPDQWFPDHIDGTIAPLSQAKLYPYPAPEGDFFMREGLPRLAAEGITADHLNGRIPVLSVGSNRAPLQLRRKFGTDALIPVTACILKDCDIVFAAAISYYGAVPATACPSPGTRVRLNVAWLDPVQLRHMHDTEALGIAYDFICLDPGQVDHGPRADGDDPVFAAPVYGYQSRAGLIDGKHGPVAHADIPATGRRFEDMNEAAMLAEVMKRNSGGDDLDAWIMRMREERPAREEVARTLAESSISMPEGPWQQVPATAENAQTYL
ncbi:hypothetical protein AB8880_09190 [Alphaproteobacteria bacterium LSUCC0684]